MNEEDRKLALRCGMSLADAARCFEDAKRAGDGGVDYIIERRQRMERDLADDKQNSVFTPKKHFALD